MRVRLLESLLMIGSIGVTYVAAEAAFAFVGLRYIPLRLHAYLPEDIRVFAQSSKAGVLPRDPVLLLGDSYAQGYGDWLLETDPNRNGPFHSAHVIQRLSGRDVVALGESGAGSAEAMAAFPAIAYADASRAWVLRLPPPRVAVVYFYEGNDLNDNMNFLHCRVENPDAAALAESIDRSIAAYPQALSVHSELGGYFPLLRFSARIVRAICGLIRAATIGQGAGFLDLRIAIRAASTSDLLHGPLDFKHFNRKGMEAMGQAVAARIDRPLKQDSCSQGAD